MLGSPTGDLRFRLTGREKWMDPQTPSASTLIPQSEFERDIARHTYLFRILIPSCNSQELTWDSRVGPLLKTRPLKCSQR
jgi:hypothetical protein